jgi:hypothetical protein
VEVDTAMTKEDALKVAGMSENALWRWLGSSRATQPYGSPAHAREAALDVLAEVVREMDARAEATWNWSGAAPVGK